MTKAVSVRYGDGVVWYKHVWLVIALMLHKKHPSDPSPQEYVARACWEDMWPTAFDFSDAWET